MTITKNKTQPQNCWYFQKGAALVETWLIAGVIATFMVGIPVIGKLIDVKQSAIQASRYAAWELTVDPDTNVNARAKQVDIRFFREMGAPISHGTPDVESNQLWGERRDNPTAPPPDQFVDGVLNGYDPDSTPQNSMFDRNRVLVSNSAVSDSVGRDGLDQGPLQVANVMNNLVLEVARFIGRDGWDDVDRDGILNAAVTVNVEAGEMMPGSAMTEHTAILVDGWGAGEEHVIRERVQGFVPTARLEKVGNFVSKVGGFIPMLKDLKGIKRAFGCVNTSVLPPEEMATHSGTITLPTYTLSEADKC